MTAPTVEAFAAGLAQRFEEEARASEKAMYDAHWSGDEPREERERGRVSLWRRAAGMVRESADPKRSAPPGASER